MPHLKNIHSLAKSKRLPTHFQIDFMDRKLPYVTVAKLNDHNLRDRKRALKIRQDFKEMYFLYPLIKFHGVEISRQKLFVVFLINYLDRKSPSYTVAKFKVVYFYTV